MSQKIKCIEKYPMCGMSIKEGTILINVPSKRGSSSYKDDQGNIYTFDNSEILFSPQFKKSFINFTN